MFPEAKVPPFAALTNPSPAGRGSFTITPKAESSSVRHLETIWPVAPVQFPKVGIVPFVMPAHPTLIGTPETECEAEGW